MDEQPDPGQALREHLFEGDLLRIPVEGGEGLALAPSWFHGPVPVLLFPTLAELGHASGEEVQVDVTPYAVYYGALRELAETADAERAALLRRLACEWNPQAALEVSQLARLHLERDMEAALLHYELALELDGTLYEALQDGGMCHYALAHAGGEDMEAHREEAEALMRRAIEQRPAAGLSWWSLARLLCERGEGEAAAALLAEFLRRHPDGEQRDMVEAALAEGFEATALYEDQAAYRQAMQLAFGEEAARALPALRELAGRHPDSGEVWFGLGAAERRAGQHAEAERCLRRAARLAPAEPFIWWELCRACRELRLWRDAEEAVRRALELDGENAGYWQELGEILTAQGDRPGAREALERALELAPEDQAIRAELAALGNAPRS